MVELGAASITTLLAASIAGDREAEKNVISLVYGQLRRKADEISQRTEASVSPSDLVYEVWDRVFRRESEPIAANSVAFLRYATLAVRRLLHDAASRESKHDRIPMDSIVQTIESCTQTSFLDLECGLQRLEERNPRCAEILQLRFFAGLTCEELAKTLEVDVRTIERNWRLARAELRSYLEDREHDA